MPARPILVDVRAGDVLARDGAIPGAIHHQRTVIEWRADPDCEWRDDRIADLDAPLILFCSQGYASSLAAQTLRETGLHARDRHGRRVRRVEGPRTAGQ